METLIVGRITAVFGVRGWVKVHSYTEQLEAVFNYQPWWIDTPEGRQQVLVDDWKRHGDGLVVHIKGVDDRDIARAWCQQDIRVGEERLNQTPSPYRRGEIDMAEAIAEIEGMDSVSRAGPNLPYGEDWTYLPAS